MLWVDIPPHIKQLKRLSEKPYLKNAQKPQNQPNKMTHNSNPSNKQVSIILEIVQITTLMAGILPYKIQRPH